MITTALKEKIILAIAENRKNYQSDSKHAQSLEINTAQYSRIKKGELEGVLSDANWVSIARRLQVQLKDERPWVTVETETFQYIYLQLTACQGRSISAILCDRAGIVYEDLVFYVKQLENPLIILDEAGDLEYHAFLELKSLWNATEYTCGWYMMGADGLQAKIDRNKDIKKVGYAEIFDRYGSKYSRVSPAQDNEAITAFLLGQIDKIGKANGSTLTPEQLFARTKGSLRKVRTEIEKMRMTND